MLLLAAGRCLRGSSPAPASPARTDPSSEPSQSVTTPQSPGPSTPAAPRKVPAVPRSADPVRRPQGHHLVRLGYRAVLAAAGTTRRRSSPSVTPPGMSKRASPPTSPSTCRTGTPGSNYASTPRPAPGQDTSLVPDAWADAAAQAQPGRITRHDRGHDRGHPPRSGIWNGQPVTSEHPPCSPCSWSARPRIRPATRCGCPSSDNPCAEVPPCSARQLSQPSH